MFSNPPNNTSEIVPADTGFSRPYLFRNILLSELYQENGMVTNESDTNQKILTYLSSSETKASPPQYLTLYFDKDSSEYLHRTVSRLLWHENPTFPNRPNLYKYPNLTGDENFDIFELVGMQEIQFEFHPINSLLRIGNNLNFRMKQMI